MRLILIGNPAARRTELLVAAVRRRGDVEGVVVAWTDLLTGRADLRHVVRAGDVVRIDSPGKDFEAEKLLLIEGAPGDAAWKRRIAGLPDERGRVWWPDIWYRGLSAALTKITRQLAHCPRHTITTDPADIGVMFDKTATSVRLARAGVPVPPAIGRVTHHAHLLDEMRRRRLSRVFLKLAHGSSASGVVALRSDGSARMAAYTTVELDGRDQDGNAKIYNTRRIRELRAEGDIARVVDAVCGHAAHAERWIPKAGIDGRTFDCRVLVIAGRTRHVVVRLSKTPLTNLHLLNDRADETALRARCGGPAWGAMMATCRAAAAAFPDTLHAGVDLLIAPDFKRHAVLELNAFGDLLPGATHDGQDPYDAELAATFDPARATAGAA